MIIKSVAHTTIVEHVMPVFGQEIDERCSVCLHQVPDGAVILRHEVTNNIICVPCLSDIASLDPLDPIIDDGE